MGYVLKDIANITEPRRVSLAALPNFLQIASKASTGTYYEAVITPTSGTAITLSVTDSAGGIRDFTGTTNPLAVGGPVFFISADPLETAENLRAAMLADDWLAANFEIYTPIVWAADVATGQQVALRSKGQGSAFNLNVVATGATYATISTSTSSDSIKGQDPTADIYVDVYGVDRNHMGGDDRPASAELGHRLVTLSKTYAGAPVWFDLNGITSGAGPFNVPPDTVGWFDAGTAQPYRAMAIRGGINRTPFYVTDTLWIVDGYGRLSDGADADAYVYRGGTVRLLTNKPATPYVRGQREYLNFLLEDPFKGTAVDNFTVSVVYRAYSTGGAYLGGITGQLRQREAFGVVNTCVLDIDALLDVYPTAGSVRVSLNRMGAAISDELEYTVRPECLHDLLAFSFINRLGGWDAVNFDAVAVTEVKPSADTYRRTVTPDYNAAYGVEAVHRTRIDETITVTGAPVTRAMADWLTEFAAARVILDERGRRILLDDFTLKVGDGDMHVPTIKYKLSETYTNED